MSRRSPSYDEGRAAERDADRDRDREPRERETMPIGKDDAAFVLGKGGSTKKKIARVCGADLDLNEDNLVLEMYGDSEQRAKARDYVQYVTQQRIGPVHIDLTTEGRGDLTVVDVPEDCVGFVMGRGGNTLRSMEEEWGSLMFFAQVKEPDCDEQEKLCIFGTLRARRGAELKVMSAVEHKHPGNFVRGETLQECKRVPGDDGGVEWSTDTMLLTDDNFSYALGARGKTRKKLATAAGCVIEYVGRLACICGTTNERRRGRDYIKWLIAQRTGTVSVDTTDRDDVTIVEAPSATIGFITGYRGESLRRLEDASGTFCFTDASNDDDKKTATKDDDDKDGDDKDVKKEAGSDDEDEDEAKEAKKKKSSLPTEKVLIFSHDPYNRKKAKRILMDKIEEHKELNSRGGGGGERGGGGDYHDRDRDRGYHDRGGGGYGRGGGGGYDRGGGGRGGYDDRDRRDRYDDRRDDRHRDRSRDRYDDRDRNRSYRDDRHRDHDSSRHRDRSRDRHDNDNRSRGGGRNDSRSRSRDRRR